MNEIQKLEVRLKEGKIDALRYHHLKSGIYYMASDKAYLLGDEEKCKEYINISIDNQLEAIRIGEENPSADEYILDCLKRDRKENALVYCAVAVDREEDARRLVMEEHCIQHLLNNELDIIREQFVEEKEDSGFSQILLAICNHDNKALRKAVEDRVSMLRRQSVDYFRALDIWSVACIKIAQKMGMKWEGHLIEIPEFLLDGNGGNL
ncbi:MAG: hypothetical protein NC251_07835 [Lachnoclostridium sp.]|nr:hypothetical protein [Lachnospira sp.]MCM1248323.1 hypothetical protein [Lachnoclostridium sp.]